MRSITPETLFAEARDWPKVGQYELVCRLAESLGLEAVEDDEPGLTPSQWAELERRLDSDEPGVPAEQVLAEVREHLRTRQQALDALPVNCRPRRPEAIEKDALGLGEADRRSLTRRVVAVLANDPWYTDEMRALADLLGQPMPEV